MATIARNDPCPCGSGKKYKKCCLPKTYIEIGKEESIKEGLVHDILKFAKNRFGDYIDDAYDYFWDDFDPEKELDKRLLEFSDVNFWEWVTYDWIPDEDDGRTLIEHFMESNKRLTPDELKVLSMMNNAVISLYEVQEVFSEKGFLLKDLLMGGEYDVRERMGTRFAKKWDIFAARLLHLDSRYIMSGCIYPYHIEQKERILNTINKMFEDYRKAYPYAVMDDFLKAEGNIFNFSWYEIIQNPPKLKLFTTHGEPFLFSKAIFEISDRTAVIEGLKTIKEFEQEKDDFIWHAERDDEGSATVLGRIEIRDKEIILECNSKKRLEKGKEIILSHLSALVRHKADTYQDMFKAMESSKDIPEKEPGSEIPLKIKQEVYTQFIQKHCEKWLNEKIPALNGNTPIKTVKTEEGKKRVAELLKQFENIEEDNKKEERPYYDMTWMWGRLGIERE
jgi:hypothetical protein